MNDSFAQMTIDDVLQEYGISEQERREIPAKIIDEFIGGFIPTAEDIKRPLSESQLVELCQRVRCRVDMWRWNPVHDYAQHFKREGRLQKKTTEKAHKLLAKAVNRHKAYAVYSEEEIRPVRERLWRERKKENLLRLELWEYDRQQQCKTEKPQEDQEEEDELMKQEEFECYEEIVEINTETQEAQMHEDISSQQYLRLTPDLVSDARQSIAAAQSQQAMHIESNQIFEIVSQTQRSQSPTSVGTIEIYSESQPAELPHSNQVVEISSETQPLHIQSESSQATQQLPSSNGQPPTTPNTSINVSELVSSMTDSSSIRSQTFGSACSLNYLTESQLSAPTGLKDFVKINTESMSLGLLESQNSEQCSPAYQEFGTQIPYTSTQGSTAEKV